MNFDSNTLRALETLDRLDVMVETEGLSDSEKESIATLAVLDLMAGDRPQTRFDGISRDRFGAICDGMDRYNRSAVAREQAARISAHDLSVALGVLNSENNWNL